VCESHFVSRHLSRCRPRTPTLPVSHVFRHIFWQTWLCVSENFLQETNSANISILTSFYLVRIFLGTPSVLHNWTWQRLLYTKPLVHAFRRDRMEKRYWISCSTVRAQLVEKCVVSFPNRSRQYNSNIRHFHEPRVYRFTSRLKQNVRTFGALGCCTAYEFSCVRLRDEYSTKHEQNGVCHVNTRPKSRFKQEKTSWRRYGRALSIRSVVVVRRRGDFNSEKKTNKKQLFAGPWCDRPVAVSISRAETSIQSIHGCVRYCGGCATRVGGIDYTRIRITVGLYLTPSSNRRRKLDL